MNEVEVYAICDADSISRGWVQPFTLARFGAGGMVEPFPIVIGRDDKGKYFAYVNTCPHQQQPLYDGPEQYLDSERRFLMCGKHGAKFHTDTGLCAGGPCEGAGLERIAVALMDGDVCISGVTLVEEDEDGPPEVMITSD